MASHLSVEQQSHATIITISRLHMRNAISVAMWEELGRILDRLSRGEFRPIIIRGDGSEAFSAGSDLAEFDRMTLDEVNHAFTVMEETISRVERAPMPVLAAINGFALGSALELACACDFQVAAETARLGMPVARLGIMLSPDFAKRIVALIGPTHTKYLLFTGRQLDASEAHAIGLVTRVVPAADLEDHALALAREMAGLSRHSLRAAKQSVFTALPAPVPGAEGKSPPYFIDEKDFREGVTAFLSKRRPRFQ